MYEPVATHEVIEVQEIAVRLLEVPPTGVSPEVVAVHVLPESVSTKACGSLPPPSISPTATQEVDEAHHTPLRPGSERPEEIVSCVQVPLLKVSASSPSPPPSPTATQDPATGHEMPFRSPSKPVSTAAAV